MMAGLLFLVLVGTPLILVWKFDLPIFLHLTILSLLYIWMVPEVFGWGFIFYSLYWVLLFFIAIAKQIEYREENMSKTERIEYYKKRNAQSTNKQKFSYKNLDAIKCTYCSSHNVEHLGNKRKSFSVGKAAGGTILTGGIGSLAGFIGKKGKQNEWHCKNCGNIFVK